VIVTVPAAATLKADAISPDGQWVHVGVDDRAGWIYKDLVADLSVTASLPAMTENARSPMQAFYFTSGVGDVQCSDAPDMLFVQGPKAVKVDLNVNGADIQIGSTIALKNTNATYQEFSSDPKLAETYSTTLTYKDIPADSACQLTSIVMLEGLAILNDEVSALPIGYAIDSVSCRDASGQNLLTTPWRGLRRLTQEELQEFAVIEKVPDNVLSYHVHIPTDQEIDEAARLVFKDKPTPTLEATATETTQPTAEQHEPPQPTPEKTEDSKPK
jgi:hypothetical protein